MFKKILIANRGEIACRVIATAKKNKCDLIVMATHGRHGLDALIHGSLTKSVLAHSQVPLLVVH